MQPFFSNNSCNPFAANDGTPCELGNLVSYAVEVEPSSGQDDVRAAVRFARENNVRLVVRSTGHECVRSFLFLSFPPDSAVTAGHGFFFFFFFFVIDMLMSHAATSVGPLVLALSPSG